MKRKKKLINPCIDCLTYAICRSQYMDEYNKMIEHNMIVGNNTTKIYVAPVLSAYRNTLLKKCMLIQQYLYKIANPVYNRNFRSMIMFNGDQTVKKEMLNSTFIDPKFLESYNT